MYPILFSKTATTYTSNGLGRLSDAHSCTIEEELNGTYELELKIGMDSELYSDIQLQSVIQAYNGESVQLFDVYKISRPINGIVTVNARHVRYRLNKSVVMPFTISTSSSACASALAGLNSNAVEPTGFTFSTDVTTASSYTQKLPSSIGERLAGVEGSILDQFGGQYEFDNFNVILHNHRGNLFTNVTLKYGKNLTDLKQEQNIANTLVGVVPYWTDADGTEVVTIDEKAVYSSNASQYPRKMIAPHDFSQLWETAPTKAALKSAAQAYVSQTGFGVPKVSIKISFVLLSETEEYKDIAPLEQLHLGDTVTVIFEELGVANEAQIVSYKYDVLREKYISMEVGSLQSNLATTLNDEAAKTVQSIDFAGTKILREANATAQEAINNATAWLTNSNGYVVAVKNNDGSWKELLFMNTPDTSTATNVLRINNNGIGFSTTGVSGPYTNAWTIDGKLVASFIKTGILSDLAGKFSLNMSTGALNMKDGTFKGTINGSTINLGTYNSVDGNLNVYNSSGVKLFDITKNGFKGYAPNSNGVYTYDISYGSSGYITDIYGNQVFSPFAITYALKNQSPYAYIGLIDDPNLSKPGLYIDASGAETIIGGEGVGLFGNTGAMIQSSSGTTTVRCVNGDVYLSASDDIELSCLGSIKFGTNYSGTIQVYSTQTGWETGYTGTLNGIRFVNGLAVGSA